MDDDYFTEEEVFDHLEKRKKVLDGIAITGGEPLLQKDIERFLYELKETGIAVKLDTNGCFPEKLDGIIQLGLVDYVAMDIKNCPEKYGVTVGIESFDITPVEKSIELLKDSGIEYEFRTTITENFHTIDDIAKLAEWIQGAKRYFLQNFVDSGMLIDSSCKGVSKATMYEMLEKAKIYIPNAEVRGI